MRRRLVLTLTMLAGLLAGVVPAIEVAQALPQTCGPYVDMTPGFGVPGQTISVNVYHYPPNIEVKVIARVTGDPVIGTGTTDAEGHVNVMVTIPAFTGDYMNIFVYAPPCNAAGAHFFYRAATPVPATNTPTPTPATPPPPPPTTVVAPPTPPAPPSAGSGGIGLITGNTGFDLALVALALVVFSSGFTLLGSSRRRGTAPVSQPAAGDPYRDEPPAPFN